MNSFCVVLVSCFSGWLFLESLRHCTGVFLVWFFGNASVSDPDLWDEVPIGGDNRDSTSFSRITSSVCMFLWVSVSDSLWIFTTFVSGGCYQTTSWISGSIVSVISGLSKTAPEWKCGISSLNVGFHLGTYQLKFLAALLFLFVFVVFFCFSGLSFWRYCFWFQNKFECLQSVLLVFHAAQIKICTVQFFYSSVTSVDVCQLSCWWHVGS